MRSKHVLMILLGMLGGSPLMAQEPAGQNPVPCHVQPVFHCAQHLEDGTVIGHFGYSYTCSDGSEPELELYVDIGEENLFSPGAIDRGQSKIFWAGDNVDVFEVEFEPEEIEKGTALVWTVQGRSARVSYTKSSDGALDCSELPG